MSPAAVQGLVPEPCQLQDMAWCCAACSASFLLHGQLGLAHTLHDFQASYSNGKGCSGLVSALQGQQQ